MINDYLFTSNDIKCYAELSNILKFYYDIYRLHKHQHIDISTSVKYIDIIVITNFYGILRSNLCG